MSDKNSIIYQVQICTTNCYQPRMALERTGYFQIILTFNRKNNHKDLKK